MLPYSDFRSESSLRTHASLSGDAARGSGPALGAALSAHVRGKLNLVLRRNIRDTYKYNELHSGALTSFPGMTSNRPPKIRRAMAQIGHPCLSPRAELKSSILQTTDADPMAMNGSRCTGCLPHLEGINTNKRVREAYL